MECLPSGQVLDRERYRERRVPFQSYHPIRTGEIPGHEVVVDTVGQAVGRFECSGRSHEDILLEQQPVLGWDDVVSVFDQRVCCVTDLFDLVIHSSGFLRVELESRVGLDTVERWLVEELDPTRPVVPGNVVHDLERRTTREIEVNVTERSFANRWQNMRTVYGVVIGFGVLRWTSEWSGHPVNGELRFLRNDRTETLCISDFDEFVGPISMNGKVVVWSDKCGREYSVRSLLPSILDCPRRIAGQPEWDARFLVFKDSDFALLAPVELGSRLPGILDLTRVPNMER
jgi:hypothetical protein